MYSKGVDVTLEAIAKLRTQLPNLRVVSFGAKQPENDFFLKNGDIEFHLLPPQDELRDIYSQCDVWITASRSEGFNLPAMEAMACRTPIASTKAGWPEDAVVTGHNGVLVDVDDVTALEQGIFKILSLSDEEWQMMSANAFATVESSSWGRAAYLFEAALKRVNEQTR
jgi:glycosyltransferase involved in cell wall biosynthesis